MTDSSAPMKVCSRTEGPFMKNTAGSPYAELLHSWLDHLSHKSSLDKWGVCLNFLLRLRASQVGGKFSSHPR